MHTYIFGIYLHVKTPFLFAIYLDDIPVNRSLIPSSFVVMYADDILLIISPICQWIAAPLSRLWIWIVLFRYVYQHQEIMLYTYWP